MKEGGRLQDFLEQIRTDKLALCCTSAGEEVENQQRTKERTLILCLVDFVHVRCSFLPLSLNVISRQTSEVNVSPMQKKDP